MVDESLVKEEMVETLDSSQSEGMDTGMQYGHVGSDTGMDGSQDDHSSHMIANKYDQPVLPGQTQPLADAVAEALAGPSGMQGVRFTGFCLISKPMNIRLYHTFNIKINACIIASIFSLVFSLLDNKDCIIILSLACFTLILNCLRYEFVIAQLLPLNLPFYVDIISVTSS